MTEKTWLLSEEEILKASQVNMFNENGEMNLDQGYLTGRIQVAKAQAHKIYEWGNEPCPHDVDQVIHSEHGDHDAVIPGHYRKRRECHLCWETLNE